MDSFYLKDIALALKKATASNKPESSFGSGRRMAYEEVFWPFYILILVERISLILPHEIWTSREFKFLLVRVMASVTLCS